ncbi:MAG: hypothetical protein LUC38_05590 [Oscillospiraceae bacterium]|nr:hypothetical protein [Ruminococcus sp.]MCD8345416.1 hypothetical protein [Oscillospiraceae bacterium]
MTTKEDLEKLEAELAEILKDIEEIDKIISEYDEKGTLNRDKAIDKIVDVRRKNQAVQAITVTTLGYSIVPLPNASNEALLNELRMQRDILQTDYLKKESDAIAMRGKIRLGI